MRRRLSTRVTRVSSTWTSHRGEVVIGVLVALVVALLPVAAVLHYVHFDADDLPDIEPFIRFELPTTGSVLDSQGVSSRT
jgi:hypothetical protein